MAAQYVKIKVSDDGKNWKPYGTFLTFEKALLSYTWSYVLKAYKFRKIVQGKKILA